MKCTNKTTVEKRRLSAHSRIDKTAHCRTTQIQQKNNGWVYLQKRAPRGGRNHGNNTKYVSPKRERPTELITTELVTFYTTELVWHENKPIYTRHKQYPLKCSFSVNDNRWYKRTYCKTEAASNREIPEHNTREKFTETGLSQPETSKFSDLAVIMVTLK